MKSFLLTIAILSIHLLTRAQFVVEGCVNKSGLRTSGSFIPQYYFNSQFLQVEGELGIIGKKKFDGNTGVADGYNGSYDKTGYQSKGFSDKFSGFGLGIGYGIEWQVMRKGKFELGANSKFYLMTDAYASYVISSINGSGSETNHAVKGNFFEQNITLAYSYSLGNSLRVKLKGTFPVIYSLSQKSGGYRPMSAKLPLSGFEPYISLGLTYQLPFG